MRLKSSYTSKPFLCIEFISLNVSSLSSSGLGIVTMIYNKAKKATALGCIGNKSCVEAHPSVYRSTHSKHKFQRRALYHLLVRLPRCLNL